VTTELGRCYCRPFIGFRKNGDDKTAAGAGSSESPEGVRTSRRESGGSPDVRVIVTRGVQGVRTESGRVSGRVGGSPEGIWRSRRESGGSPDESEGVQRESGRVKGSPEEVGKSRRVSGGSPDVRVIVTRGVQGVRRESEGPEESEGVRRESG